MKIRYLGHACFQCISDQGTVLITDPYTNVGYELPQNLSADVVTVSHAHFDHNYVQAVQGGVVIDSAGDISVKDIKITGIPSWHDDRCGALRGKNLIFKIEIDGIILCHMGDVGETCSPTLLEKMGKVDVLLIPVGGTYTVDAQGAKDYVDKIAPNVVIPMHYRPLDGKLDIATVDDFLKLFPQKSIARVGASKQSISIEELKENQTIVYMERE